ncbi:hypothetical protein [Amaricoccus macauensis]|uniref:hypothetical protein n=1 Tax=Amaricoccus macauensis TaxID=57001 RepID=UPI003C7C0A8A
MFDKTILGYLADQHCLLGITDLDNQLDTTGSKQLATIEGAFVDPGTDFGAGQVFLEVSNLRGVCIRRLPYGGRISMTLAEAVRAVAAMRSSGLLITDASGRPGVTHFPPHLLGEIAILPLNLRPKGDQ